MNMKMFSRIVNVVKANLNDLISKAEDPKKMLEQIIIDMQENLAEAKKEVAGAIADEKRLYAQMQEQRELSAKWEKRAALAVEKGDEPLALEALKMKKEADKYASEYETQWTGQKQVTDRLKSSIHELQNKIEEAQRKKNLLIARQKRAEAQQKIQSTMSKFSDTSAFDSFARMEDKVNDIEARAEAEAELNASLEGSDIDSKFKDLEAGTSGDLQDELAALKAKMGK
jgi:phage shock protein A